MDDPGFFRAIFALQGGRALILLSPKQPARDWDGLLLTNSKTGRLDAEEEKFFPRALRKKPNIRRHGREPDLVCWRSFDFWTELLGSRPPGFVEALFLQCRSAHPRKILSSNVGETRASTLAVCPRYSTSNVVKPVIFH